MESDLYSFLIKRNKETAKKGDRTCIVALDLYWSEGAFGALACSGASDL